MDEHSELTVNQKIIAATVASIVAYCGVWAIMYHQYPRARIETWRYVELVKNNTPLLSRVYAK